MTVGVVDFLEPVHIKHHEPDGPTAAYGPPQFKVEGFVEESAIV